MPEYVADWKPALKELSMAGESRLDVAKTLLQAKRWNEAEAVLRGISREDNPAEQLEGASTLAALMQAQGRLAEAATVFRRAISLAPGSAELRNDLGNALLAQGLREEAVAVYREAIWLRPGFAEVQYNLGNALRDGGDLQGAAAAFTKAIALRPGLPEAHNNLGNLTFGTGHFAAAADHYRRAIAIRPNYPDAHFNLGNALKAVQSYDAALVAYQAVGQLAPGHAGAHNNAGEVLEKQGRLEEAGALYARAIALDPNLPEPYLNLGQLLGRAGRLREALDVLGKGVALRPEWTEALAALVHVKHHACDWAGLEGLVARLRSAAQNSGLAPPFILCSLDIPGGEQTAAARRWAASIEVPAAERLPRREPRREGKIRIGYLSADLHNHATACLAAEVFERHDRDAFDVIAYSYGPDDGSAMRDRLVRAFDNFVDLRGLSDKLAAELIHEDEIDILVDLKGYTQDARTRILAYRPAPLQVNWLGFPGSMGADFIDYVIADRIVAPERFQKDCTERIVHLPDTFQPNDRKRPRPGEGRPRSAYGLPDDAFVFCSFNNSYKITAPVFERWMRLLGRLPGSVLWLLEANDLVRTNLMGEAARRGIDPARLVFAPRVSLGRPYRPARRRRSVPGHIAGQCTDDGQRRALGRTAGPDLPRRDGGRARLREPVARRRHGRTGGRNSRRL